MKGKAPDDKAKILDYERISCGIGGVIPDPAILLKYSNRMQNFSKDLNTMT